MSTFLINASNLKEGGGVQVAQSICDELRFFDSHHFVVMLSTYIDDSNIRFGDNIEVIRYNLKHDLKTVLLGRDSYLDAIVNEKNVDGVLTVFGPSIWRPRVPHLCGFARAQIILKNSPYYKKLSIKERVQYKIWEWSFGRSSDKFYTENPYISEILESFYKKAKVYTVTNYYNQVFDQRDNWRKDICLPKFDGVTCLSVAYPTPHKNFGIIEGIVRYLRDNYPDFKVRFVLTCKPEQWSFSHDVRDCVLFVGKTDVSQCPYLYEQSDIMFMPSLMECFTATYPEAMRMNIPIVTTDLEFAKGLCGDAACYYSAVDAGAAAEAIYKVATDMEYRMLLTANGKEQLKKYDNYKQRTAKLVSILEEIIQN